jgi:uncharacterized GH25 family protein
MKHWKTSVLHRIALLAATLTLGHAHAHHVWIEQGSQGAVLHFGEFADNLREVSPGSLDKFTAVRARIVSSKGEQALSPKKGAEGFTLSAKAGTGESIVAEADYPAFDKKVGDKTLRGVWLPAARFVSGFASQTPALELDIVPTGKAGEFQVFYRGQPLPKAKVSAIAMSGWSREAVADDDGKLRFSLPWQGVYGIEVRHQENAPSERAGEKFDTASYVTTLSFTLDEGLPSPASPPKATPKQ